MSRNMAKARAKLDVSCGWFGDVGKLEYDGIFDAATVLTDRKPNCDCSIVPEQWKWKRQHTIATIISRSCRAEASHNLPSSQCKASRRQQHLVKHRTHTRGQKLKCTAIGPQCFKRLPPCLPQSPTQTVRRRAQRLTTSLPTLNRPHWITQPASHVTSSTTMQPTSVA